MDHQTRSAPTRILLVSPLPPPPGGMQTWTETLLRRGLPKPFAVDLVDTRQTVKRRRPGRPRLSFGEAARFFRILWRFRSSLRAERYALAHLNSSFTPTATLVNLGTTWIARRAGVPYVIHLHGTFRVPDGPGLASRLYRRAYRRIFDGAAWILLLSKPSERAVLALGNYRRKTTGFMPNFIDFHMVPSRTGITSGRPMKVVFTGRIWPPKGIATIASVAERVPGAVFQLVGGGPSELRDAFIRDLESRHLLGRVSVLDPRPNKDVLALLAEADVFFFPSLREGLPNSVLEAMAVGLPVVASNVGAIPEIIDEPDGGMLLDPGDVDGFAQAIDHLRIHPELRNEMGRYNRIKAERNYDYDVVVNRLCGLYDDILAIRVA